MNIHPSSNYPLPNLSSLQLQYVGQPLTSLPTPAAILDRSIIRKNCDAMLNVCKELGVGFRAHVKSHKVRLTLSLSNCIWEKGEREERRKQRVEDRV
jgi:D-serine deaminase-like pyridoxal phosphate-dependent protein